MALAGQGVAPPPPPPPQQLAVPVVLQGLPARQARLPWKEAEVSLFIETYNGAGLGGLSDIQWGYIAEVLNTGRSISSLKQQKHKLLSQGRLISKKHAKKTKATISKKKPATASAPPSKKKKPAAASKKKKPAAASKKKKVRPSPPAPRTAHTRCSLSNFCCLGAGHAEAGEQGTAQDL